MFQVTFSDQCMRELNQLPIPEQMELVEAISSVRDDQLENPREPLGRFTRDGKTFYRLRAGEYRCYFEVDGQVLRCDYFLHKNTFSDFVFRAKLPLTGDMAPEEQHSFWEYLEHLQKPSDD